jgi:hypothetical protein
MSEDPDTHELTRRVNHLDALFEELREMLNRVLEWKNRMSGGLTVLIWGFSIGQAVVLSMLGFAALALKDASKTLGNHAKELAVARTQIDAFMAEPRFTADHNAAADARLVSEMRAFVRDEIAQKHQTQ